MKRMLHLGLVFSSVGILIACGGHREESGAHEHGHDAPAAHEATPVGGGSHGLSLDGSSKWKMDDHTREMFERMAGRLEGKDLASSSAEDLKGQGAALRQDVDDLIAGCTMVGAAHDELHKYLIAYIPAVDRLTKSGDSANADEVKDLLGLYPHFFE